MDRPTQEERDAYKESCEDMGIEESLRGLLEYVSWSRGVAPAAPAESKAHGSFETSRQRRAAELKGKEELGKRIRGILTPQGRAVRTAISKCTRAYAFTLAHTRTHLGSFSVVGACFVCPRRLLKCVLFLLLTARRRTQGMVSDPYLPSANSAIS